MRRAPWLFPCLVSLAAFALALVGLDPSFYMDDSPEITTVSATLGVAHPPGYPLYILLGRLLSLLPLGPVCLRVNLLAALAGALVVLLLFLALSRVFGFPDFWAAPFSMVWMAGSTAYPAALSSKNGAYLLAGAFLLAVLACLLRGKRTLAIFLFGLSLAHHWMTMLPALPGFAWLLLAPYRDRELRAKEWLRWTALGILGLSLYLYLPLRSALGPGVDWGHPLDLTNFWRHVTRYVDQRKDFTPDPLLWARQAFFYLRSAWGEFAGLLLLAPLGFWALGRQDRDRAVGIGLTGAGLLGALCVFSKFSSQKAYLMQNYSIATYVLIPLLAALGLREAFVRWGRPGGEAWAWGFTIFLLALRVPTLGQSFYTYTYDYLMNAWRPVPRDSLFFCKGDVLDFPAWYLQRIEGKRPDLPVLGGGSLEMDWYRIGLAQGHPGLRVPYPEHEKGKEYVSGKLALWIVERNPGQGLFFTYPDLSGDGMGDFALVPEGLVQEAFRPGTRPVWDGARAESLWGAMRLRHFQGKDRSLDPVSWDDFLKDYGMARLWMADHYFKEAQAIPGGTQDEAQRKKALYAQALPHLLWAQDWDPTNTSWAMATGLDEFYLGDRAASLESYRKAAELGARDPQALYQAGVMAYQLGEKELARRWFGESLALDPTNGAARRALDSLGP